MLDRVGKYEIKRVLGKGASGTVYLARDTFSDAEVAVKVIDSSVFADPELGKILRTQFLNEASLAGRLHHPHIVSILDAVVTEDSGHIAMEYVPGGKSLEARERTEPVLHRRRDTGWFQVLRRARLRVP